MQTLARFAAEEEGLEVTEFAIIAGIIVVGVFAAMVFLGNWTTGLYQTMVSLLP